MYDCSQRAASIANALLILAGCGGDGLTVDTGEVVRLHTDRTLCASFEPLVSREVDRIQAELDLQFLNPVDVFMDDVEQQCVEAALPIDVAGTAAGCAIDGETVAAGSGALSHELVHALRIQHGIRGTPFFEEGVASVVGTHRPLGIFSVEVDAATSSLPLRESAAAPWDDYRLSDLMVGTHFSAWAFEAFAGGEYQAFLASEYSETIDVDFQDAFGIHLDAAEARWREESLPIYVLSSRCDGIEIEAITGVGIERQGSLACDDPETEAFDSTLLEGGRTCFRLEEATNLRLELDASLGILRIGAVDCAGVAQISVEADSVRDVSMPACTWAAVYSTTGAGRVDSAVEYRYRLSTLE